MSKPAVQRLQRQHRDPRRKTKVPTKIDEPVSPPASWSSYLTPARALSLPLGLTLGLAAFGLLAAVRENPRLLWAFWGAAAVLLAWNVAQFASAQRKKRTLTLSIEPRKQHYLQACAQLSVFLYWGWYWPPVYSSVHLIAGQLVFAYAFDMLLAWSRRDTYSLGFAPFPVIFSINLFLWFKPDWFYLQFLMVALGFAAKELIRWDKEGRRSHIFNPSSFPLAVFSLGLLLTGTSDITWGSEIANTQFFPPHIYLMLFLIGLPGQFFFGVTSMTMSAVVVTYLFGLLYFAATGIYFFFDSYIPIAVFLGMHLLFTDPSTSPRTELGRILFGALYGLSTILLYQLLNGMGWPTFYDKLLQVPILNLSIKLIDRAAHSDLLRRFDPAALGRSLVPRRRNLAYMSIWATAFVIMSAFQGVGDGHRGQFVPFWQQACDAGRPYACPYLADMQQTLCFRGSGWACNEFGQLIAQYQSDFTGAAESFQRGCGFGFATSCTNLERLSDGSRTFAHAPPTLSDYPIILRGTKGPISDKTPSALYARACDQGWPDACGLLADAAFTERARPAAR
jgi:hypothetical protein